MPVSSLPRLALTLAVVAGLGAGLPACDDRSDEGSDPVVQPGPEAGESDAEPAKERPLTHEEKVKLVEKQRAKSDEDARGLMASFKRRAYDPSRDDLLQVAEGVAELSVRHHAAATVQKARFQMHFDASLDPKEQVTITPISGEDDVPKGSRKQVHRLAVHSFRGGYHTVVLYHPPTRFDLLRSRAGGYVVHCPPYGGSTGVSYNLDDRQVVATRGVTNGRDRQIDYFEWSEFGRRYFLDRQWPHDSQVSFTYEYANVHDTMLLREATLALTGYTVNVTFEYTRVEKR